MCLQVQRVLECQLPGTDVVFPLKPEYDRAFRTVEGLRNMMKPVGPPRGVHAEAVSNAGATQEPDALDDDDAIDTCQHPNLDQLGVNDDQKLTISPEEVVDTSKTLDQVSVEAF